MPDDRLLHRSATHSAKVSGLTDLEYRVWTTYILCADDFGVMRFTSAALRSSNDALEHKPTRILERSFQVLVDKGLIRLFEHQGKFFAYQTNWQDYQSVRYPRQSVHPIPPSDLIAGCTKAQQHLFSLKTRKDSAESPEKSGEVSRKSAESPQPARAGGREWLTANGNGKRLTAKADDEFENFWAAYPKKVGKKAAHRIWTRLKPDAELQQRMAGTIERQRRDPNWIEAGGKYIPNPETWLNQGRWDDQPVEVPQVSEKSARSLGAIYGND